MRSFPNILISLLIVGCVEKEFDSNRPEYSYQIAKEPFDNGNYEIALNKLKEFKARFPYSRFSQQAELLIADSNFELSRYPEAAATYEQFVTMHPKHPKVEYAIFRIGESYWADAPTAEDRDQELTSEAIKAWRRLIDEFPNSEYTVKAKALVEEGSLRIAEGDAFVAGFYCKMSIWHACAYRSANLAKESTQYPKIRKQALNDAITAFNRLAELKKEAAPDDTSHIYFRDYTVQQLRQKASDLQQQLKVLKP